MSWHWSQRFSTILRALHDNSQLPALAALAILALACGSRSGVSAGAGGSSSAAGPGATSTVVGVASAGSTGGGPTVPTCGLLSLDSGPVTVIDVAGRNAHSPSLVAPPPEGNGSHLVVQAVLTGLPLPSLELASLRVDEGSIAVELGPTTYTSSFSWSPLGLARTETQAAMVWENEGLRFGTFDVTSWSPGPTSLIAPEGGSPIAIVGGASLDGSGRHEGEGFGLLISPSLDLLTWPSFAIVDDGGMLVLGPLPVTAPHGATTVRGSLVWTGSHYLIAVTEPASCGGAASCTGLTLFRFTAGSSDEPFERMWSLPSAYLLDVALAPVGDEIWLVFIDPGGYDAYVPPTLLRVARDGVPIGAPTTIGSLPSAHGVRLAGIPGGALITLRTASATAGEVVALQLDEQGGVIGPALPIADDDFVSWGPGAVAAFDGGVAIAGASSREDHSTVSVTTLRCTAAR